MVPMVTKKAALHDWSPAEFRIPCPLNMAIKRKLKRRRSHDAAKQGHTDTVKGCNRAYGMAVVVGCRNIRGHLHSRRMDTVITVCMEWIMHCVWRVENLVHNEPTMLIMDCRSS
jgi:hypothetical protein